VSSIEVAAGRVEVRHRLALVIEPVDRVSGRAADGVRVARETARNRGEASRRSAGSGPRRPAGGLEEGAGNRFLLRYGTWLSGPSSGPDDRPVVRLRLDDGRGRWVPRRFAVTLHSPTAVAAADEPVPGAFIPAAARRIAPRIFPGAAYPLPRGTTGVRFGLEEAGRPVPWARVSAFGRRGVRIGSGQGDVHGQVLLVLSTTGAAVPVDPSRPDLFDVLLRVDVPTVICPPAGRGPDPQADPLDGLPLEAVVLGDPAADAVLAGTVPPPGYRSVDLPPQRVPTGVLSTLPLQTVEP
jgi:hypothetical protein